MVTKRKFGWFLLVLLALLPLAVLAVWPSSRVELIACQVGQGDALLITKGFTQVLIDGGPNDRVMACLAEQLPFWDRTIELVVNTHPDKDHLAGLNYVMESYRVRYFVSNGLVKDSRAFKKLEKKVADQNLAVYIPRQNDLIKVNDLSFKVLWPDYSQAYQLAGQLTKPASAGQVQVLGQSQEQEKANENSIVLLFEYRDFEALLTGDITAVQEEELINEYQFEDIEVLKVAHHGSKYSSSESFLAAVKPEIAIISVGKNPWGHPTKEVLDRLKAVKAQILRTDQQLVKLKL